MKIENESSGESNAED